RVTMLRSLSGRLRVARRESPPRTAAPNSARKTVPADSAASSGSFIPRIEKKAQSTRVSARSDANITRTSSQVQRRSKRTKGSAQAAPVGRPMRSSLSGASLEGPPAGSLGGSLGRSLAGALGRSLDGSLEGSLRRSPSASSSSASSPARSEEHTSELQSREISYAVFCL